MTLTSAFWEQKTLAELSREEWESLCDGCAKCCLHKLEDEDTGEIFHTDVACRLLDLDSCQCSNYAERFSRVPYCFKLTPENLHLQTWLPETCAYRLLFQGSPLPNWHPLVSGDRESIHRADISVRGKVVSEQSAQPDDMEDHIIHWVE